MNGSSKQGKVYVALVHWPVLDRAKNVVATNVTNFDIHDIARACRTYGVEKYFIVNRMREQLMFVSRVLDHWKIGFGKKFNPMRRTALGIVETVEFIEDAIREIGGEPYVVATSAKDTPQLKNWKFTELRDFRQQNPERDVLLLFGTGFGLDDQALKLCDGILEPIRGSSPDDYRHLSVRSAVSICLDRLLAT